MKTTRNPAHLILALALLGACLALPAQARTILTTEHTDVGIGYEDDAWDLHIHLHTGDQEFEPDEVLLYVGADAQTTADAFLAGFTGAAEGDTLWVLPQSQDPRLLYLGVGLEETDPVDFGFWDPSDLRIDFGGTEFQWIQLTLVSVNGPGEFSMYTDDGTVWMSSAVPPTDGNHAYELAGGHGHYNWAFSEVGLYEITISATAELADGSMSTSAPATYLFGVETIPEPTSGALLLTAGIVAAMRRRRRS